METKQLTNTVVKGIATDAMVLRVMNFAGNLEEYTQTGYYVLIFGATTTEEEPPIKNWQVGILEVFKRYDTDIVQRLTQIDTGKMCVRTMRQGVWKPWKLVTTT